MDFFFFWSVIKLWAFMLASSGSSVLLVNTFLQIMRMDSVNPSCRARRLRRNLCFCVTDMQEMPTVQISHQTCLHFTLHTLTNHHSPGGAVTTKLSILTWSMDFTIWGENNTYFICIKMNFQEGRQISFCFLWNFNLQYLTRLKVQKTDSTMWRLNSSRKTT